MATVLDEVPLVSMAEQANDPDGFAQKFGQSFRRFGFAMVADPAAINWPMTIAILFILVLFVTMVYGPIAAILVEMFPTRIRYTGMSLPYHIGNGWFGGLLPATVFALSAYRGDIYYGLWYPVVIAAMSLIIGTLFVKDTLGTDLNAKQ